MNEFTLYTFTGDALFDIVPEASSSHEWVLMSENRLSLTFELEQCVNLSPGCYIDFDGVRYYLLEEYKPQMVNSTAWKYNVNLFDAASWMSVTLALNLLDGQNTPIFNYTAPALEHAQIIVANLNRRMGTTAWKVGSVLKTGNIAIEYRGKYCSDVLQEIVDDQNTEWWLDGMTLNIGRAEFGDAVELGYGNGLLGDIVCEQTDNMRTYAYLCPIGSTRNIDPTKYGFERLQLPNGQTLVPMNPEQGIGELAEEKAFSKIFPRYEGTVKSVRSRPAKGNDGREFTIYYIGVALPFNPNEYEIAGLVKQITFLSGQLMSEDFEANYDSEAREFEIITRWPDGGDAQLPGGLLTPEVGDKYVIWNITMPDVYYTLASQEFLEAAEAFAAEAIKDVGVYKAQLDYIEVQERGLRLRPGQRVRLLSDAYFASGYYDSRITRITRDVLFPDAPRIEVSAVRATGTISRIQTSIQKTEAQVARLSGALPTVVKSGEDTTASDSSVYTSAKSEREFLNRRKGGTVLAPVDFIAAPRFPTGADFNGAVVKFDAERKCWIFPHNLLVEGGIAWNTKLGGFEEQTVTAAVRVDWETIGKNENGELYVIGGTSGGGGGVVGGVTLDEVKNYLSSEKYTTETWVSSQNYATQSWVTNKGYITGITDSMVTSALGYTPFDAANFTKAKVKSTLGISDWALESVKPSYKFSDITNQPTTLSGYGITDVYTKTQVDSALAKKWTQDDSLIADWNTAYDWGNHATAGYAKPSDIQNSLAGYLPIDGIAEGAKTLKGLATSSSWIVAAGNGFNVYNNSSTKRCWFGFSLPEGSPYATTKWVFGASDSSYNAGGEIYANHISLGYGDSTTTEGYALRANGNAKIDGSLTLNGKIISYNASKNAFVLPANVIIEGGIAWNSKLDGFDAPTIMDAVVVDGVTITKENGKLKVIGDVSGGINESQLGDYLTRNNYAKKSDIPSLSGYATESFVTTRGYITASAIPTKVSAFTNDASYATESFVTSRGYITSAAISKANIKSILGISDWALDSSSPFATLGKISTEIDSDSLLTGVGYTQDYSPVEGASVYGQLLNFNGYRGHTQFYIPSGGNTIYLRSHWDPTGMASRTWKEILTSGSYANYALSLTTDQTVTGIKNFVNGIKVGGNLITYDTSLKAFVLNGNLIVKGGIAWEKQNS